MSELVTLAEAAALSKCSADTIKRRIRRGEIPAVKVGKAFQIERDALGVDYIPTDLRKFIGEAFQGVSLQLEQIAEQIRERDADLTKLESAVQHLGKMAGQ